MTLWWPLVWWAACGPLETEPDVVPEPLLVSQPRRLQCATVLGGRVLRAY